MTPYQQSRIKNLINELEEIAEEAGLKEFLDCEINALKMQMHIIKINAVDVEPDD